MRLPLCLYKSTKYKTNYRIRPFKRPGRLKKKRKWGGGALIRNKIIVVILIENAEIPIKIGKVFKKKHGRKSDKLSKSLLPC